MYTSTKLYSLLLAASVAFAQGPPPGGPGGFGRGPGFMFPGPGPRTIVTGAPYSGTQTSQFQQTLPGGNQISRQEQSKVYRDLQGRVRIESTRMPPGSSTSKTVISIIDPVGGYSYMLDPAAKTAAKIQLPPANTTGHTRPAPTGTNAPQTQTDDLGKQTINGVPATGTRITETIPAGAIGNAQPIQIVRETWISTDLKVPVLIKTTDPRFGNTTMQLTNIAQSEPDAALFQVPSDFTVTTRSGRPGMGGGAMRERRPPPQEQ